MAVKHSVILSPHEDLKVLLFIPQNLKYDMKYRVITAATDAEGQTRLKRCFKAQNLHSNLYFRLYNKVYCTNRNMLWHDLKFYYFS